MAGKHAKKTKEPDPWARLSFALQLARWIYDITVRVTE